MDPRARDDFLLGVSRKRDTAALAGLDKTSLESVIVAGALEANLFVSVSFCLLLATLFATDLVGQLTKAGGR